MASLNQIVDNIAGALNQSTNFVFKQRVKFSVLYYRAEFIRQDSAKNGLSNQYMLKVIVPLISVDQIDNNQVNLQDISTDCNILRTENKIPTPIRINMDVPFKFVGSADSRKSYTKTHFEELNYTKHNKYTYDVIRYDFINGYIYVFNAKRLKFLGIHTPFESYKDAIALASNEVNPVCYTDDMEFPISMDMIRGITQGLMKGELRMLSEDNEVHTNIENAEKNRQ